MAGRMPLDRLITRYEGVDKPGTRGRLELLHIEWEGVSIRPLEPIKCIPHLASDAHGTILETAADKFVGLTRRAGAELAGLDEPDPTLVRHLHDLHALRDHYDAAEVVALAREVMLADAEAYGNQFPAYRQNLLAETLRAVEGLAADPGYARRYGEFKG